MTQKSYDTEESKKLAAEKEKKAKEAEKIQAREAL